VVDDGTLMAPDAAASGRKEGYGDSCGGRGAWPLVGRRQLFVAGRSLECRHQPGALIAMSSTSNSLPVSQPPQLQTRKPRLTLPPGSVDCHCHIFGAPPEYPYAANRIFDPAPGILLQHYLDMLQVIGVERAVIVQTGAHGTDNRVVLDAIAASGGRMRGVALIPADISDDDLDRLHAGGIRGFRANLVSGIGVQFEASRQLAARVARLGWHVQYLLDIENFPSIDRDFADFPVEVVIDHMGRPDVTRSVDAPGFQALLRLLRAGRAWAKLSAPYRTSRTPFPHPDITPFARALVDAVPHRLVWGTDWPHVRLETPMPNDGDLVDLLAEWVPDEGTRKRILVDNAEALYGF
jgi:2-pyrone-4,6-dicarboxylate lactonase